MSAQQPLVSVIMCTRDRPRLVGRAIQSILKQTYENFELVIADGGTNNDTKQIVRSFDSSKIRYHRIENEINAASTMNFGLTKCAGKYVAFQDDDDESFPQRLEKQVAFFESLPEECGMIYCWEEFYDDEKSETMRVSRPDLSGYVFPSLVERGGQTGGGTQLLIRSSVIKDVGGFDEGLTLGSDYLFYLKISEKYKIEYQPDVLVRTHVNHIYQRTSDLISSDAYWIRASVEVTSKILARYCDYFKRHPAKAYYHLEHLMISNAKLRDLGKYLLHSVLLFRARPFRCSTVRSLAKGVKCLARPISKARTTYRAR